ncbi:MAG: single-stranded DNA-binding protein [Synergistaceae bacterium]|nr:single-stranded DNA-binding protein [Synergistaceae bacterium]
MRGFNRVIIAGNLTRDPELRYTVSKRAYARFGVAINSRWKNANGELQETTEYINVVVWGPMAENCGKFLKKGSPVLVEGSLRTSTFEARDGSGKRYMTEINADNVIFLSSREQGSSGGGYSAPSSAPTSMGGGYTPTDEDFGKSIGESGFGGTGGYSPGFASDEGNSSDGGGMADIPF